jgi:hypothetical protein
VKKYHNEVRLSRRIAPGVTALLFALVLRTTLEAQAVRLSELSFMSGCWEGPLSRGGTIEEFYSAPTENLIVGTTRYVRDGQTVMFEFTQITTDDEGILLLPYPRGSASEHPFRLTALDDSLAVFEAPEHDFPKRISYIVTSPDAHIARVDDGTDDGKAQEWLLNRVACPGSEE